MRSVALFVGFFIAAVGLVGTAAPQAVLIAARYAVTPLGLYVAALLRVTFGVVLLRVAPLSRTPTTLRILGAVILVNGLLTPFVGVDRARAILDWWSAQGPAFMRLWSGVTLAFGVFVAYTVSAGRTDGPRRRAG